MSNGAFWTTNTSIGTATPGLVDDRVDAEIIHYSVETAAGIGYGVVVSRGTNPAKQITVGGTNVVGITVRPETSIGGTNELTNTGTYAQYAGAGVIKKGYIRLACTGSAAAGSRLISYNTTTGAIVLGAPGAGEARLYGLTLEEAVTTSNANGALFRVDDPRDVSDAAVGFVTDVTVNGTSVVSGGTAVIEAVTSLAVGATELTGDVILAGTDPELTITDQTITFADQA